MTPAEYVINKCGGVSKTAALIGRAESAVHRWKYPKEKGGTGGAVPGSAQREILAASYRGLVDVRPEDFFPTPERGFVTGDVA